MICKLFVFINLILVFLFPNTIPFINNSIVVFNNVNKQYSNFIKISFVAVTRLSST